MNTDTDFLLQRAAWFQILAQGFAYPQPTTFCRNLTQLVIPQYYSAEQQQALSEISHEILHIWQNIDVLELESSYIPLFLANATCPLNETAYGDGRSSLGRPSVLADISGFYTAFGMEINEQSPNLPDHLGVELEFYSILLLKLAYAQTHSLDEQRDVTQSALKKFLEEHLGSWITVFVGTLHQSTSVDAWLRLADLLELLINNEIELLGVQPVEIKTRITNDEMQADSLVCELESTN